MSTRAESQAKTPDGIEPIVAWRAWFIGRDEDGTHRLDSVIHRCGWPRGHELVAACLTTRGGISRAHPAPTDACQCGIYGADGVERLANYLGHGLGPEPRIQAVGLVKLWGSVLVHEHGWRASCGYPERVWLPTRDFRGAQIENWEDIGLDLAGYGVPIVVLDGGHSLEVLGSLREWERTCDPRPVQPAHRRTV